MLIKMTQSTSQHPVIGTPQFSPFFLTKLRVSPISLFSPLQKPFCRWRTLRTGINFVKLNNLKTIKIKTKSKGKNGEATTWKVTGHVQYWSSWWVIGSYMCSVLPISYQIPRRRLAWAKMEILDWSFLKLLTQISKVMKAEKLLDRFTKHSLRLLDQMDREKVMSLIQCFLFLDIELRKLEIKNFPVSFTSLLADKIFTNVQ